MYTVALRFTEKFAPSGGTIAAHQSVIESVGYVWYGKMGTPLSEKTRKMIMDNDEPRILLIQSGGQSRYWAYCSEIKNEQPAIEAIPEYYRGKISMIKTWFKVYRFEKADKKIMSKCFVRSSGTMLTVTSQHSMSPYFIIEIKEPNETD